MEKKKTGAGGLLKADSIESLVTTSWDIFLFSRDEAISSLKSNVLAALQMQKAGEIAERRPAAINV